MQDGDHSYPLAVSRDYMMAYIVPKNILEKEKTAIALSQALSVDLNDVLSKANLSDDPFEVVKKRLSDEEAQRVKDLNLPGVALLPEKYRYYPAGELASQVLAMQPKTAWGGTAWKGHFNTLLKGEDGELRQEKDAAGRWISLSDRDMESAQHGANIYLTLDRTIQFETEKILKEAIEKYAADGASAIVMDPKTGRLLAMASAPQFNPNEYNKVEDYSLFLNSALSLTYEPGSIMKPITMAMGIEEGKVSPTTEYTDPGVIHIGGYDIRNADDKSYGRANMLEVLDESINTGVIFRGTASRVTLLSRITWSVSASARSPVSNCLQNCWLHPESGKHARRYSILHGFFRAGSSYHATPDGQCVCGACQWR
ncbi:MAG: penicillin-binding transpeptidase domain-containing protein [Candidatus Moraniibacteriota bacterium]